MKPLSLPQRALEMHRRTGIPINDALFYCACQHAIEHGELPALDNPKRWEPAAPKGRQCVTHEPHRS